MVVVWFRVDIFSGMDPKPYNITYMGWRRPAGAGVRQKRRPPSTRKIGEYDDHPRDDHG